MHILKERKGVILIFVLIIMISLVGIALAFWYVTNSDMKSMGAGLANMKAFYIAEAGRAKARWALTEGAMSVPWQETDTVFGGGAYTVSAVYSDQPVNQHITITSNGYVPTSIKPVAQRQVVEKNISFTGVGMQNISIGATPSASSNLTKVSNINDANPHSQWKADGKNVWEWVKLDFGGQKQFSRIVINGGKIDQRVIEYSNDNNVWQTFVNLVENPPLIFTFDPVPARYLRLKVYGNKPEVSEFESYAGGGLGQGKFATLL